MVTTHVTSFDRTESVSIAEFGAYSSGMIATKRDGVMGCLSEHLVARHDATGGNAAAWASMTSFTQVRSVIRSALSSPWTVTHITGPGDWPVRSSPSGHC
jgi:hypothetical protein